MVHESEPGHADLTAAALRALGGIVRADPPAALEATTPSVHVPARPGTVVRGQIPTDLPPAVTIASGDVVRVDTVSHQGIGDDVHPVDFFGVFGIPADEVLDDVVDVYEQVPRPGGASAHVLTGPIHVDGAVVGDTVEIRMLAADLRVPYGVNHASPGGGVLPDLLERPQVRVLHAVDGHYRFAPGISIPVAAFPGIVAVAPPKGDEPVSARPPGPWGGNIDLKDLTVGARLFLPVFAAGAQIFVGDPHGAQGDGEVDGTAVEHSSAYTLGIVRHPGLAIDAPVAATSRHVIALGIDERLDRALEQALRRALELIVGMTGGALDAADAYALCSLAADVAVAEAVNHTSTVAVRIPRSIFTGA
jgi:acetamidase/formamidase